MEYLASAGEDARATAGLETGATFSNYCFSAASMPASTSGFITA
jgi:hypothetical protein